MKYDDRWYQAEASDSLLERVLVPDVNPIAAIPTGAGKTYIAVLFIRKFLEVYPDKKIIVLSHVLEIIQQNYKALYQHFGDEIAVNSAKMNRREAGKITVAGIQSVYKNPGQFGDVGLIIVDECHLVGEDNAGMYRTFIANFKCPCAGLTATPFRSRGYLHTMENALFTEISYDLTSTENVNRLISEGYLSKMYCRSTKMQMDTKGIPKQGGDFSNKALDLKFNTNSVTETALNEVIEIGGSYKKWLIFAISIDHAEHIQEFLNENGINTGIVHSKMDRDREQTLDWFRDGFYRGIVSVNALTTGLDIPDVDMIVMLRPTDSPVVYAQSAGRGFRVAEGKDHCLVLDFANNVATHGPIDKIRVREKGKKTKGEPITKVCPKCSLIVHPTCKVCPACLTEFIFKVKIENSASDLDIISKSQQFWADVDYMNVKRHTKRGKPDSLRIDFTCGLRRYTQWVSVRSPNWDASHAARYALREYCDLDDVFLLTVDTILGIKDTFKVPKRIYVDESGKWPEIINKEF